MADENSAKTPSLKELRTKKPAKDTWLRRHCPWLFRWNSLFYYGVFLFLLGILWAAYPMFTNGYTQLLSWDYTWQYISFTYDYWDAWHLFFTTGHFPLYDPRVYLGTDMIGSGSYYGLFDPFMFICYLAPRSWIPQMYAQMTFAKLMFGGLMMRMYLKKMGISEWTARIGGIAYAFSGFTTFFEGAPNFTSTMAFFPLILYGIEQVIHDRKMIALPIGVMFLGLCCFFFVPVICIFGVIYALWRFFATIRTRDAKTNGKVMLLGVLGFATGLMLCAFSLLPSLRETMLSGRSSSIGSAYLQAIKNAFKNVDAKTLFSLIFEEVGDNPGRELMGVVSFFFPAGGWTNLPLVRGGYDAWTASLFCYTPCVVLFFLGIIHSVRLRRWDHLAIIALCVFAVLTNFSYFFFFAFSGNGYGRWYLILIPLMVYYGCWTFDQRKETARWMPFLASLLALGGTLLAYFLTENLLKGKSFSSMTYNIHHTTYWQTTYYTPTMTLYKVSTEWLLYYQLGLVVLFGAFLVIGLRKKWLPYLTFGLVAVEAVVMGNLSYAFNNTTSYINFSGNPTSRESSLVMANAINANDNSFFCTYSDTYNGDNYPHTVFGLNTPSAFHSLMNFDVETFALNNQMKFAGSSNPSYDDIRYYNPNWSGHYANKRYLTDTVLGVRYYIVSNSYSGWKDAQGNPLFLPANVPFGATELTSYSPNRNLYRVYRRGEDSLPNLGRAVDDAYLYRMGKVEGDYYRNQFFHYYSSKTSFFELERVSYVEARGAIFEDEDVIEGDFSIEETAPDVSSVSRLADFIDAKVLTQGTDFRVSYYETKGKESTTEDDSDRLLPWTKADYYHEGLAYFLNHYRTYQPNKTGVVAVRNDLGKLVITPSAGTYFNTDPRGCYFDVRYFNNKDYGAPRVYALGDTFDENGALLQENVCLSFDNSLMPNLARTEYYRDRSCTVGVYAPGRVKQLVFCYGGKSETSVNVNTSDIILAMRERNEMESLEASAKADALLDVKTETNRFTFRTEFTKARVVKTQLGYDAGWHVQAKKEDGSKVNCQMLRLDGGLVGFVAPSGNVTYTMEYETPYMKAGIALWALGVTIFSSTLALGAWSAFRKKKKDEAEA